MAIELAIQQNIPLAPLTTLGVGGAARYFLDCASESHVKQAVAFAANNKLPLFVLGGGSNLVIADKGWPGLVIKISIQGLDEAAGGLFRVGAGETWDSFVTHAVSRNFAGIECLSGIPGSVGGTPVQNVGAYGQEAGERIVYVRVLDVSTGQITEIDRSHCGFGYRASIFNTTMRGRYIVLSVAYQLSPGGKPRIEYEDLKRRFDAGAICPTLQQVRDAVREIRSHKGMLIVGGDEDCRSAGSFFKNPIVIPAEADRIEAIARKTAARALPRYPTENGMVKLSAAWLIEQAGFHKGYGRGPAVISHKHTLAIINRGGASARNVLALRDEIRDGVLKTWGVELDPEPEFVGF